MPRKLLFLIADGMGDYPLRELDWLTPLQAARTPHMDSLAPSSQVGLCQTIPENQPPGSDIANMSLLGFDPGMHHTGRGPIEASAQGVEAEEQDLVYRLNLCSVSEFSPRGVMLDHSGGHVETEEARQFLDRLSRELPDDSLSLIPGFQYRHLLLQRGGAAAVEAGLRPNPPHDILGRELGPDLEEYGRSTLLSQLMHRAHELLRESGTEANAVWPWGQGTPLRLPPFWPRQEGRGAIISAVDLVKGLGRSAGLQALQVPGATGLLDTNYRGKAEAASEFLQSGDFVYLHLEAPDECSHSGDARQKVKSIELFDELILGELLETIREVKAGCLVACDHLTPISLRTHSSDPVPFLFYDPLAPAEGPVRFSEAEAEQSGLHIQEGTRLLPWIRHRMEDGA